VNHSGDSDSTGAICGNLLGALYGDHGLPHEWQGAPTTHEPCFLGLRLAPQGPSRAERCCPASRVISPRSSS
ncbi:ADP-ribosylglycohydrolase family protein, partial [Streptomyces avermitilis]|uniref:ADP-ribosylglycohydrolase family protein n=1 Tax=Streptomyces avermitilis TaxID=33903 RepID=UPI0033A410E6